MIVEHSHNNTDTIFFNQTKILASTPYYSCHIIKKAHEIDKHPNNFNQEDVYKLSKS
jgi:hypothetical protein